MRLAGIGAWRRGLGVGRGRWVGALDDEEEEGLVFVFLLFVDGREGVEAVWSILERWGWVGGGGKVVAVTIGRNERDGTNPTAL